MLVLTKRQREVWDLVRKGWTSKEIGEALKIEEVTVKEHIARIAAKLPGPGRPRTRICHSEWPREDAS